MVKYTKLRCPGDKKHTKRRGNYLVKEKMCNTLLGFVDVAVDETNLAYKCKDCKSVIQVTVEQGVLYSTVLPSDTKIELDKEGKVVVNDS